MRRSIGHGKKHDDAEQEAWLITYADAITLITLFFLLLLSVAKFDVAKFEQAAAGIEKDIAGREPVSQISILKMNVEDIVYAMQADQAVKVSTDDRGVVLELASSAFYMPGSAEIRDEANPILEAMARTMMEPRNANFMIDIEGHTDDDPISTQRFPSNWELSAGRAARVVRFFIAQGVDPTRLKATGFAETRPKLPNREADGRPNRENQAANRRVIVRLYPTFLDELRSRQRNEPPPPSRPIIQEFRTSQGEPSAQPVSGGMSAASGQTNNPQPSPVSASR